MLRTEDGGANWQQISRIGSPVAKILQFSFADADTGWAFSQDGDCRKLPAACSIHRTTDGGRTWQQLPPIQWPDLANDRLGVSLHFVDPQTGFLAHATGNGGSRLLVTHDGGEQFQPVAAFPFKLKQLDFIDARTGWAIIGEGVGVDTVVATDDGGQTWRTLPRNYRIPWTPRVFQGVQNGTPVNPVLPKYNASGPILRRVAWHGCW